MKEKVRQRKPATYKSPEARARQLAALSGVKVEKFVPGVVVEKVNGMGALASISEDLRKRILDLYMQGNGAGAIARSLNISEATVNCIKASALDSDSQFREAYYKVNLKAKLQKVADASLDRLTDLLPTMTGRDAAIAAGITMDKLILIDRTSPETLHQHVHIHGAKDIKDMFSDALKPRA
jgi:hypothetical protein